MCQTLHSRLCPRCNASLILQSRPKCGNHGNVHPKQNFAYLYIFTNQGCIHFLLPKTKGSLWWYLNYLSRHLDTLITLQIPLSIGYNQKHKIILCVDFFHFSSWFTIQSIFKKPSSSPSWSVQRTTFTSSNLSHWLSSFNEGCRSFTLVFEDLW